MTGEELCFTPAADLAGLIATRTVSPVEVMQAAVRRAEALDASLNIFAAPMFAQAMEAARAAEVAVMSGAPLGKLHGVPVTIKDNIAVAGAPLENGSAAMRGVVADSTAEVARRVLAAGAIPLGKTNLPEFAHKVLTDSPAFGVTRNPWNLERTPGGSSGGASAALAAGVAPIALGTDGGGSIRCPAACAGVFGLKATLGRIPNEAFPDAFGNYAFVGPMTRTAADLALLLSVLAGAVPDDPYSLGAPLCAVPGGARGVRIGWVEHFGRYRTDPNVARLTREAVRTLEREGAHVEPLADPCFNDVFDTYVVIATVAHAARLAPLAAKWRDRMSPSMLDSIEKGGRYRAVDLQCASDRRTALFRSVQALFSRFDVIATPTMTAPPPRLDAGGSVATAWYAEWAAPLYPFNLTGHPAVSVPAGFTGDGLPVGLQLVAPWWAEQRLLDLCRILEQVGGWGARRPPVGSAASPAMA